MEVLLQILAVLVVVSLILLVASFFFSLMAPFLGIALGLLINLFQLFKPKKAPKPSSKDAEKGRGGLKEVLNLLIYCMLYGCGGRI